MQDLAERLDNIRIRVRAPGTEVEAEFTRRTDFALFFEEGAYAFVDEAILERTLTSIAKLLWVQWQRQYRRAIEDTDLIIDAVDSADINFFAERDEIEAVGVSSDHRITISTTGLRDFSVHIKPGTVRELTERRFSISAAAAAKRLLQDYQEKVEEVKQRYQNSAEPGPDTISSLAKAHLARLEVEQRQQTLCDDNCEPRSKGFHERAW
ncbi:hypothetical protein ACIA8C_23990 [Nocardia sp. NPDC051321]|uniref:hypothetical protein n=1 Tax=Nocardia sp. NPDC051321 TaxID=3364323 RepID=UPI003793BB9B